MPVQVRGTVKFLPTQQALVHLDVTMENGMSVKVVGSVEPLAANLAEKLLVLRIKVSEDMTLELVLPAKLLPTHLTGYGDLLRFPAFSTHNQIPHHLHGLESGGTTLDEGQALAIDRICA